MTADIDATGPLREALGVSSSGLTVIYDGDCIFCANYVGLLRLRKAAGSVRLVNARDGDVAVLVRRHLGIDLDEGMLVLSGDTYHYGPEAMTMLSLMSTGSGLLNGLSARIFANPKRTAVLYPFMKTGRALTLRLMRRRKLGV